MPHVTKHTRKVLTWAVKPYACDSSREKRQQDRRSGRQTVGRTDRQTHTQTDCPKPLFSTFWGLYIPNPVLSRSQFFARCQYFHWHGSKMSFEVARYELWADNSAAATRVLPALPQVAVTSRLTLRVVNTQMEAVKVVFRSTTCDLLLLEKL